MFVLNRTHLKLDHSVVIDINVPGSRWVFSNGPREDQGRMISNTVSVRNLESDTHNKAETFKPYHNYQPLVGPSLPIVQSIFTWIDCFIVK